MKKITLMLIILIPIIGSCRPIFKTGDIIFHTSKSSQSKLLQDITKSKFTHVGVIFLKDNKLCVFESIGPVTITPLDKFIKRGVDSKYSVMRYKKGLLDSDIKSMIKYGKNQIGRPYDIKFQWSNDKIYCSELIWKMYKSAGIELCEIKEFKDYYLYSNDIQIAIKDRYDKSFNVNDKVVAPVDLYNSKKLFNVYSNY